MTMPTPAHCLTFGQHDADHKSKIAGLHKVPNGSFFLHVVTHGTKP